MTTLQCISRSGLRIFYIEQAAFNAAEKWYTATGAATFASVDKCDRIFIDCGGSVFVDEPTVNFEANGIKFESYLRHLPFITTIINDRSDEDIKGCIKFGGFPNKVYILTIQTANALRDVLARLWDERRDDINMVEERINKVASESDGKFVHLGGCSCQSGYPYKMCCGRRN